MGKASRLKAARAGQPPKPPKVPTPVEDRTQVKADAAEVSRRLIRSLRAAGVEVTPEAVQAEYERELEQRERQSK